MVVLAKSEPIKLPTQDADLTPVIHSLKLTDKRRKVSVKWSVGGNNFSLESDEEPRYSMLQALDELLDTVIGICYLDDHEWEKARNHDRAFVSGISMKHDGGIGCVITAQFKPEEDPYSVVINTPFLKPEMLDPKQQALLQSVEAEAIAYIQGERAQLNLDLGV